MAHSTFQKKACARRELAAVLAVCVVLVTAIVPLRSESLPPDAGARHDSWIAFAEACVRLAEADLAEAESQNRRVADSVSDYDLMRLRLQRDFAQEMLSFLGQGGDYGELVTRQADLRTKLAELDVATAEAARSKNAAAVSDESLERMRRNLEVCRLESSLVDDPEGGLSIVDHLHWETHRLGAEVMRLNRRVERLEELVQRR